MYFPLLSCVIIDYRLFLFILCYSPYSHLFSFNISCFVLFILLFSPLFFFILWHSPCNMLIYSALLSIIWFLSHPILSFPRISFIILSHFISLLSLKLLYYLFFLLILPYAPKLSFMTLYSYVFPFILLDSLVVYCILL